MKTTKIVLGLAVAAAAGAAIGMLLAPEKGADLQKKLRDGARQWMDELNKMLTSGQEFARGVKKDTEDEVEKIKSNLRPIED